MRELESQLEAILEAADLEDAVLGNDHGHRWPGSSDDTEAIAAWSGTVSEIVRRGNAITDAGKALNRELRLLHGDEEHCVRCSRSAPAHESDEYPFWQSDGGDGTICSDGGDGMICPACLTTDERQRADEVIFGVSRASDVPLRRRGE
jgi:hypothetical protein